MQERVLTEQQKEKVKAAKDIILKYIGCKLNYRTFYRLKEELDRLTGGKTFYISPWKTILLEFGYTLETRYNICLYRVANGHLELHEEVKNLLNHSPMPVQLELPLKW